MNVAVAVYPAWMRLPPWQFWLRGSCMTVALILINVARTWAELTPRQAANLELGGLLLAGAFTIEAAGAALGSATMEAVTILGRVIGQGLRQGGFTGFMLAASASTVLLSGVAVSLVIAAGAIIVVSTILVPRIAEILRESHPVVTVPTPFPTGPGTEEIPGTQWEVITFPDPLPYRGWLPHPPLLAGCTPRGSFVCWDYGFDGVPPGFWWQYDHWPHHPPLILPPPDYTPWWERGLEAESLMLLAEEVEGFVEADFLIGPDGRPRGFAFNDRNDPALNAAVADLVALLPGGGPVELGDITNPKYVDSVLNPTSTPPSASIPVPATLLLLTVGLAVAGRLRRRSR